MSLPATTMAVTAPAATPVAATRAGVRVDVDSIAGTTRLYAVVRTPARRRADCLAAPPGAPGTRRMSLKLNLGIAAALGACLVAAGSAAVAPKPAGPAGPAPFVGAPATAKPITGIPKTPRNPFMAPAGQGATHNDSWQTDTYPYAGPLGRNPVMNSTDFTGDCISVNFDRRGRIVAICQDPNVGPTLYMFDPNTLEQLGKSTCLRGRLRRRASAP